VTRGSHAKRRNSTGAPGRGVSMALQEAMRAHRHGHLDQAEPLYRKAIRAHAAQPDALHFLGVLCHQRGRSDEGIDLIRQALRIIPGHADVHNNLGNIFKECGRLAEAEASYRHALDFAPHHADALGNLAIVLEAQSRPDEALQVYEQLLEHAPELARAHYLMGSFIRDHLNTVEDIGRAVTCFRNAVRCDSRDVRALKAFGVALYMAGEREEAIGVYRNWLQREPDNPVPRHMLASCGGEAAPPRADDAYVTQMFDSFAESFDEQLLNKLAYRAPQVLMDFLGKRLGAPQQALDVLDAGCGTGLCGPLVRPYARRLSGVDLSGGMVEKARARSEYDVLEVAELTAYLQTHPGEWDVILSADTLVYFGDLTGVLAAAWQALRPSGWLGFTLEALADETERTELSPSGRYQHTHSYVESQLASHGFQQVTIAPETLRKEMGVPVPGWVVLACREASV
jgi:predicted TPR repeat methyltransferase